MPTKSSKETVSTKKKVVEDVSDNPNDAIISMIKQDHRYRQTISLVKKLMGDVDLEELCNEVEGYQERRGKRKPLALQNNPKTYLIKYASEDASYRSRVSFIQSQCRRVSNKINFLLESFDVWIMATYGTRLRGTVPIKNAIVSDLTHRIRSTTAILYELDECCGILIEDIDQGQWQRKAIISVLEIESKPEGKV